MKKAFTSAELKQAVTQLEMVFDVVNAVPVAQIPAVELPEEDGVSVRQLLEQNPAICCVSRIITVDGEEMVLRMESVLSKETAHEQAMTAREEQIYHDDLIRDFLSGTYNRRYWETEFCKQIETYAQNGTSVAVAMITIDGFDALEEKYGALDCDQLVCYVGNLWKKFYDENGEKVVCRIAKSTFVIGCVGANETDLENQIRYLYQGMNLVCTSTCGMLCRIPFTLSMACAATDEVKEPTWEELQCLCQSRLRGVAQNGGNAVAYVELT